MKPFKGIGNRLTKALIGYHRPVLGHATNSASLERVTREVKIGSENLNRVLITINTVLKHGPAGIELSPTVATESRQPEISFGREVVVHASLPDTGELTNLPRARGTVATFPHQLGHCLNQLLS